jgi:uncharacterized protein (DUF736 family)
MSDYDDTNRGALFKNDKKATDKHPDYKGSLNVEGVEFYVSAWIKTSKAGSKYMSLAVTAKDASAAQKPAAQNPAAPAEAFDEEIPF